MVEENNIVPNEAGEASITGAEVNAQDGQGAPAGVDDGPAQETPANEAPQEEAKEASENDLLAGRVQIPSVGRIVTYRQEGAKFAAIITERVNIDKLEDCDKSVVSLYVISPSDAYFARNVEKGDGDREWSWPEMV